MLSLKLLGEVSFAIDGEPIKPLRSKTAAALLIYLACHHRPFPRSYLAEFFWEGRTSTQSAANLRTALKLLRPKFADYLIIERQSIAFNHDTTYEIDALSFGDQFEALLSNTKVLLSEQAVEPLSDLLAQYQGGFLDGFFISSSPAFEAWQREERKRYQQLAEKGLRLLIAHYLANGKYQAGIREATRLLTFDPYDEAIHRDLMTLYWRGGNRNGALLQFVTLKKLLDQELEIPPTQETTELFQRIRSTPALPKHNLPLESTPFIGREDRLAELESNLSKPECRLMTILGPGGMGKTRLLLEIGRRKVAKFPGQFSNGVQFFPLSQLSSGFFLDTALAETLKITLAGGEDALPELINYLREKELLLLLDNFEQLLEEQDSADRASHIIEQIIQSAPHTKIVITSRERLRLREEWVHSLTGLSTPPPNWIEQLTGSQKTAEPPALQKLADTFEAVRLFVQSSRRIDRHFELTPDNIGPIGEICQQLEGLPLGIELAAAWVRGMTPKEIITRLQSGFDFLRTPVRNMPERHRTLRNLFDHTWQMLDESEAAVMRRLSVFRGPFTPSAADAIAQSDPDLLLGLVDKSMLQIVRRENGLHYAIHELLRRYAAERLALRPKTESKIKAAHGHYFANFIQERTEQIKRACSISVLEEVADYIDELRAAWKWSRQNGDEEILIHSLEGLFYFFWTKGWLQEGAVTARQLKDGLRQHHSQNITLLTQIEMWEAEFYTWLGRYEEAKTIFLRLIREARQENFLAELNFSLIGLGRIEFWEGNYDEAKTIFEESLAIAHQLEDGIAISLALNCLANTLAERDKDYPKVYALYEESLAVSKEYDDQLGAARALINMGVTAFVEGKLNEARSLCQESLEIYQEIGYPHGIGAALKYLSQIAISQKDYQAAKLLIDKSYTLNHNAGDRRAVFESLCQLGNIARNEEDYQVAIGHYNEALKLAVDMNSEKLGLALFLDLAELLRATDRQPHASRLINFILENPRSGQELISSAQKLLENSQPDTPTEITKISSDNDYETIYEEMVDFAFNMLMTSSL